MKIEYTITDVEQLNKEFVDYLYDNEELHIVTAQNDEVVFLWGIIDKFTEQFFKSKDEFMKFIETLTTSQLDNVMYYSHRNELQELKILLNSLLKNNTTVDTFDKLFFEFLKTIKLKSTITLSVNNYILLGGNNILKVNKIKKQLLKSNYTIKHKLRINFFKKVYIFIKQT